MTLTRWISGLTCLCAAGAVQAMTLEFPATATSAASEHEALSSYELPIGPAEAEKIPTLNVEGQVHLEAWHMDIASVTTLQLLAPLRDQLTEAGFDILFECDTQACGGFDFRYGARLLPEPAMHVNLGDFRYLSAVQEGEEGPMHLGLLVSRAGEQGFVHLVQVGTADPVTLDTGITASTKSVSTTPVLQTGEIGATLEIAGRVVLGDLAFASGSSQLDEGDYGSLVELADYLLANPKKRIVLVGHTDAEGGLDGNIALSKKRATSVQTRLVEELGVPTDQVAAEGVGYLVPVASNQTTDGRDLNRRVEAILSTTE